MLLTPFIYFSCVELFDISLYTFKMPKVPQGTEQAIQDAIQLLEQPADPVTGIKPWNFVTASLATGCSRYTLSRRYQNLTMSAEDATYIANTLLSLEQEKALVRWALFTDDWGFPLTYELIEEKALVLAKERNPEVEHIGIHWVGRFLKRPVAKDLKARLSNSKDRSRQQAQNPDVIRDFFIKWRGIIERYGIRPEDIYNFDEKGVMIGQTGREWVVTRRDRKTAYAVQDGNRESVTIVEAIRCGVPIHAQFDTPAIHPYNPTETSSESSNPISSGQPQHIQKYPHLLPPWIITAGQTYTAANFKYIFERLDGGGPNILAGATFRKSPKGYTSNEMNLEYVI